MTRDTDTKTLDDLVRKAALREYRDRVGWPVLALILTLNAAAQAFVWATDLGNLDGDPIRITAVVVSAGIYSILSGFLLYAIARVSYDTAWILRMMKSFASRMDEASKPETEEPEAPEDVRVVHIDGAETQYNVVYGHTRETDDGPMHIFMAYAVGRARRYRPDLGDTLQVGVLPARTTIQMPAYVSREKGDPES